LGLKILFRFLKIYSGGGKRKNSSSWQFFLCLKCPRSQKLLASTHRSAFPNRFLPWLWCSVGVWTMKTLLPTLGIWKKKKVANIKYFYIPGYEELISAEFIKSFIQKVKHKRLQVISWGLSFYHLLGSVFLPCVWAWGSLCESCNQTGLLLKCLIKVSPYAYNCMSAVVVQVLVFPIDWRILGSVCLLFT